MKGGKIIRLKIKEINNELEIVNEALTDRELTSNYYINEYFRLCDKIILMSLNLEDGIVMNIGKDTYVIKESLMFMMFCSPNTRKINGVFVIIRGDI